MDRSGGGKYHTEASNSAIMYENRGSPCRQTWKADQSLTDSSGTFSSEPNYIRYRRGFHRII